MADTSNTAEVVIGAKIDEAVAAIAQLKGKFEGFAKETSEHFDTVGSASEALLGKIKALAVGFLSFEGIKKAVETTKDLAVESLRLSQRLGMTTEAASVLAIAIGDVHGSVESFEGLMQRMGRQMKTNEQNMNAMGVATRDSAGNFLNQQQIMFNGIEVLKQYEAGTNRNAAARAIFGGRVGDLTALMKLNNQVYAEARTKAIELGLVQSGEGLQAVNDYRKALNDIDDVMKAFAKVIGETVIPVMTSFVRLFTTTAPEALIRFRFVVATVAIALVQAFAIIESALNAFGTVWDRVFDSIERAMSPVLAFAAAREVGLGFKASAKVAWEAWKEAGKKIEDGTKAHAKRATDILEEARKKIEQLADPAMAFDPSGKPKGKTFKDPEEARKIAEAELQMQIEMAKKGAEIGKTIIKELVEAKVIGAEEAARREWEIEVALYESTKKLMQEKAKYAKNPVEAAAAVNAMKLLDEDYRVSNEKNRAAIQAGKRKDAQESYTITKESLDLEDKLYADYFERLRLYYEEEAGYFRITQEQKLAYLRAALIAEAEQRKGNLTKQIESPDTTAQERIKLAAQIREIDSKLQTDLQKNAAETTKYISEKYKSVFEHLQSTYETVIQGMIMRTMTWRKALGTIFTSILGDFIHMCLEMISRWAIVQAAKKAMSAGFAAFEQMLMGQTVVAQTVAAGETVGVKATEATMVVEANAAEAASGAAASVADIPFAGWLMAPVAFAAVLALALGAKSLIHAAGGFDVPSGINPVAQLHQEEMVLPAHLANAVRSSIGGGGGGDTFNIHLIDKTGVEKLLMRHGPALADSIRRQYRNFSPVRVHP
jgi:hypothetical protein